PPGSTLFPYTTLFRSAVTAADRSRAPYPDREVAQQGLGLPPLPTTTIGSFPQTADVRRLRSRLAKGELTVPQYDDALRDEIARVDRKSTRLNSSHSQI